LVVIALTSLAQVVACGVTDHMKSYSREICAARVTFDLHPDAAQPAVQPQSVSDDRIPRPGDIFEFVHLMYDYKGSWQLEMDGNVVVVGTVMRRTVKRREEGISFFDIDRLFESMKNATPGFDYQKVGRSGGTWIKRTKLKEVPAGQGRNVEMEWLVPLREDILLIFRVALLDYATRGSQRDAKWYQNAEAMQQRIFESLQVALKQAKHE
jgi:hypothetical protein